METKTGQRAMAAAGATIDKATGKTTFHSKPMTCTHCKGDAVTIIRDDAAMRVNNCDDCGYTGVITKGSGSWWYHDWQMPGDMAPAWHERVFG